jgi:hypothetical protein
MTKMAVATLAEGTFLAFLGHKKRRYPPQKKPKRQSRSDCQIGSKISATRRRPRSAFVLTVGNLIVINSPNAGTISLGGREIKSGAKKFSATFRFDLATRSAQLLGFLIRSKRLPP